MQIIPNSFVIKFILYCWMLLQGLSISWIICTCQNRSEFKMSCGFFTGEDLGQRARRAGEAQMCSCNLFVLGRAGEKPLSAWVSTAAAQFWWLGRSAAGALLLHIVSTGKGMTVEINAITQPLWLSRQTQRASDHPTCHMSTETRPRPFEDSSNFSGPNKILDF